MDDIKKYESLIFNLFYSAGEKLISASELHITKYSYRTSFFLSIIAQEELAKLIMIPIANELGELRLILDPKNRSKSPYYSHSIKQNLFTSFGLHNRSYKKIEKIKQEALYVGYSVQLRVVDESESYAELENGWRLLFDLSEKYILPNNGLSKKFKQLLISYLQITFNGFLAEKLPALKKKQLDKILKEKDRLKKSHKKKGHVGFVQENINLLFSNPFTLISFFKSAYGHNYKKHLAKIKYRSIESIKHYIISTNDEKTNDFKI